MAQTLGKQFATLAGVQDWSSSSVSSVIAIHAAVKTRFLDHLGNEPRTIDDLAAASGLNPERLGRLIGFLASQELLTLDKDGRVSHTAASRFLQSDHPGLMHHGIMVSAKTIEHGQSLNEALRRGGSSFEAHFGMGVFDYVSRNPDFGEAFGKFMSATTGRAEQAIFSQHRFLPFTLAVDVGGSHGTLLLRLLSDHPSARGILFDMPAVVAQAHDRLLQSDVGSRIEAIGGSFFENVPEGGDLYIVKQVLHDWKDEECAAILSNIRKVIAPNGRLAIIDRLLPETNQPHSAWQMDFFMMLWTTGRERKLSEFNALLNRAGFRLDRVTHNSDEPCVIEAVPC
jgi:O-methyltransferase domain